MKKTAKKFSKKAAKKKSKKRISISEEGLPFDLGTLLADSPPRATIGVVAPSAPAPLVELEIGANRMIDEGFQVFCHPQVKKIEGLFAGSDTERALAFLDYAFDPELQVIWAARGGYGAIRILPILDEITEKVGRPEPKLLVGFSDATVLLEYVRTKWAWRTLHAPMPATNHIDRVQGKDWARFGDLVAGDSYGFEFRLRPIFRPESFGSKMKAAVQGEIVGGNLAMIQSVVGTPYAFDLKDKILFLEEIGEAPYRMDRMLQQLLLSRSFDGVRAIVLGTFTDCRDATPSVYAAKLRTGKKPKMKPLRPLLKDHEAIEMIFGDLGETLGIPVFYGLPVGHGIGFGSMELGVLAELSSSGALRSI